RGGPPLSRHRGAGAPPPARSLRAVARSRGAACHLIRVGPNPQHGPGALTRQATPTRLPCWGPRLATPTQLLRWGPRLATPTQLLRWGPRLVARAAGAKPLPG